MSHTLTSNVWFVADVCASEHFGGKQQEAEEGGQEGRGQRGEGVEGEGGEWRGCEFRGR